MTPHLPDFSDVVNWVLGVGLRHSNARPFSQICIPVLNGTGEDEHVSWRWVRQMVTPKNTP